MPINKIAEQLANIQGVVFALTLLDTYPTNTRLTPAFHALHNSLEMQVSMVCESIENFETQQGS